MRRHEEPLVGCQGSTMTRRRTGARSPSVQNDSRRQGPGRSGHRDLDRITSDGVKGVGVVFTDDTDGPVDGLPADDWGLGGGPGRKE